MRAIVYEGTGGTEVIRLREVPTPVPGEGEVRVRVHATGLNRADILQRRGGYPAPAGWPQEIPGLEFAGEVESAGPGATEWKPGQRVMGLVGGGAHAEYVVVREGELLGVPPGLDWPRAAAVPEAFLTAWDALVVRARVRPGERVLIHAVASGIGTAAVQVARRLGATVIGTSRSADKLERLSTLGLSRGIDTSQRGFREQLDAPVDVILDLIGGPAFGDNLDALAPRGRMVLVGFLGGGRFSGDLGPILRKRLEVIGTIMRSRGPEERRELAAGWRRELAVGFDSRELVPVVGAELPMAEMAAAQALMEGDALFGKCVLMW